MNKKELSEQEIRTQYITPSIQNAGWEPNQIREEVVFTKGKIIVRGKTVHRGEQKRADYILYYQNNFPLAIVEAKDNKHSIGDGMQQALGYGETLNIPFVFSSNGDGFIFHDGTTGTETELGLHQFPSPEDLYKKRLEYKGITPEQEEVIKYPYYDDGSGKTPRYYQEIAINRTVEAILKGQKRNLLVMATGTGKTYTAFQIIWRLWKSGIKKRILFLADRNILVDQTMVNDFKPFGGKMTKITHRKVDKAYEIYLALYQGLSGSEEFCNIYKDFSPDFFDLIIVDECHRGSANENSAWRDILTYFSSATQIGLTATPKEENDVSTQTYFGKPIYTYSLKQGIEDGFLAPYKVIKATLNVDEERRPYKGQLDYYGEPIPDKEYNNRDYDKTIIIKERTEEVAKRITEYLKSTDRMAKTIVFCVDIDHADRMRRALVNENADMVKENNRYVMKITGDDIEGKHQLDNFISPKELYPVIVTTSKLLTTGVDAQTCKVIVLDTIINSMTEFKQIIGRGTRIREDYGKHYFTIIDFRKATRLFADPLFDGEPEIIYNPKTTDPIAPEEIEEVGTQDDNGDDGWIEEGVVIHDGSDDTTVITEPPRKIIVNGVKVKLLHERVQYLGPDGKLITESLRDYSKKNMLSKYENFDKFLEEWSGSEKKKKIIEMLSDNGVFFDELKEQIGEEDVDPFDLVCHLAFDKPALSRAERAKKVKKETLFSKYGEKAKEVIEMLIQKYTEEGIEAIEDINVLKVAPFSNLGTPYEIITNIFGTKENYRKMLKELEDSIYEANYA